MKHSLCFLVLSLSTPVGLAQVVVDRRVETQISHIQAIGTGEQRQPTITSNGGIMGAGPGTTGVETEVELITYGYQLPDFDPENLYTYHYRFMRFSDTGIGSGSIYPDPGKDGYVEYEVSNMSGDTASWQTLVYATHATTGDVLVYIDVTNVSVNKVVTILNNLALNAATTLEQQQARDNFRHSNRPHSSEQGERYRVSLSGDHLSLDDLREQVFAQTRCNIEDEAGFYHLAGCL